VSQHSDLTQKSNLIVEELLLDDLPVLPSSDRAELELERLVGGGMHLTIEPFDGPYHPTRPSGDGARPVTGSEHYFIRVIVEVVLDGLEESLRLGLVRLAATRRLRLAGPENRRIR
jgi:hypothetical protein